MSDVLGYAPGGDDAWLVFGTRPGSYDEESLVEFLGQLHGHLGDDKVTIIWDGLPSHRSKLMKAYVASQRRWLVVERLPAYAPDLNPVELLWGNLKGTELVNFCPATLDEAATAADAGLQRIGEDAQLCWAFLAPHRSSSMTSVPLYYANLFRRLSPEREAMGNVQPASLAIRITNGAGVPSRSQRARCWFSRRLPLGRPGVAPARQSKPAPVARRKARLIGFCSR